MNILEAIETWWTAAREVLAASGVVGQFRRSSEGIANPSCHVTLERGPQMAELIAWRSGMADFNFVAADSSFRQEHFDDIQDSQMLGALLARLSALGES